MEEKKKVSLTQFKFSLLPFHVQATFSYVLGAHTQW